MTASSWDGRPPNPEVSGYHWLQSYGDPIIAHWSTELSIWRSDDWDGPLHRHGVTVLGYNLLKPVAPYQDAPHPDPAIQTPVGIASIPDQVLLGRAVKSCRSRAYNKGSKHPRWVAVMDAFALGSGFAHELCRRFDLDPDEQVSR